MRKINSNSRLSEMFLSLARDLDVMEPKSPEEVGKKQEKTILHFLASINETCGGKRNKLYK